MKKSNFKVISTFLFLLFIIGTSYGSNDNMLKLKRKKYNYNFIELKQNDPFTNTSKYSPTVKDNGTQFSLPQTVSANFNAENSGGPVYSTPAPFQELNGSAGVFASSEAGTSNRGMQRANNGTNDDPEFPGDPGQFPIGDGGYIIALALAVYTFFKFRLTFKK